MNLDKNQIIGIVLIAAIIIGFQFFPSKEEFPATDQIEASDNSTNDEVTSSPSVAEEKVKVADSSNQKITLEEKILTVTNNSFSFKISSKGARIYDFKLADYNTYYDSSNVTLIQKEKTTQKTFLNGEDISSTDLDYSFNVSGNAITIGEKGQSIILTAKLASGKSVSQKFTVPTKGFLIRHEIYGDALKNASELSFELANTLPVTERLHDHHEAYKFGRTYANVNYVTQEGDFDDLGAGSNEDETIEESLKWFAFKQRFFTVGISPTTPIREANFKSFYGDSQDDLNYIKKMYANYKVSLTNEKEYKASIYAGPNDFYILESTKIDKFGKNVDLGWLIFGVINRYVILPVFDFLADNVASFGLVILLLVLIIKIVLFPIAFKSYSSMAKMKAIKPDLDKLKEKFGDDQQGFAQAQMGFYRQAGVNPVSGCIPQLLQIPILFALFRFFPNAIQLRGESFLWAKDLSTYDELIRWDTWIPFIGVHISIFTVLMTLTTLVNSWYNSQFSSSSANNPMGEQMKYIIYFMPLIFFFVLNDYPSGLTFYYFISTLFTIGQQYVANKMIDPEKVRSKIQKNIKTAAAGGGAKKSRFQQRLEAQMALAEEAKKKKKK